MRTNHLLEQIAAPENLMLAWRQVRGNIPRYRRARSAGPDGITLADFEAELPVQLPTTADMLLMGRYQPQAPARFTIKKRGGGERTLAVLNVRDRLVQRATTQVLEQLWEPEFLDCSYGFRPGRSVQHALDYAQRLRADDRRWVVDGDIHGCFDHLNHHLLMKRLSQKVDDRRVLRIIYTWLEAGLIGDTITADANQSFADKSASWIEQGMQWAMASPGFDPGPGVDYYGAQWDPAPTPDAAQPKPVAAYSPASFADQMQKETLRRMAVNTLLVGGRQARNFLVKSGFKAAELARGPVGRSLLTSKTLAATGLVGLAAVTIATAVVMHQNNTRPGAGVLQGSPISPLLMNIYLHPFDVRMVQKKFSLVRYADDWIILAQRQDEAEQAYNQAIINLDRLHLKLNREKSHIQPPEQPLEWLGGIVP